MAYRPPDPEYRFDVFGRRIAVVRRDGRWRAFDLGNDGKRRLANFVIPVDVDVATLAQYLGDLFHEAARPGYDTVRRLPG
ncbi:MAG: hypothetical protein GAK40_00174 [Burkholderia plantarii]|nr:MAG: hypothetical protein GAK40_00174 [Burkholderia plantarii]